MNLYDNTVEGIRNIEHAVFSIQYHQEACPRVNDPYYLFECFRKLIKD